MTRKSFQHKFRLLRRWDYACVVCGRPFANLACVTTEHIMPRHRLNNKKKADNHAPSHWRCNMIKSEASLMATAKFIEEKASRLGNTKQFINWLNAPIPNRPVPYYALLPISDAEWFMFK